MTYIQTHICDSTKFIQDTINIYMASLTTNTEENTTPETTTIVSYLKKSQQITHHFTYLSYSTFCNNSQKLTTHIHIHNNIKKKSQKKMKI